MQYLQLIKGYESLLNLAAFFSKHPLTRDAPLSAWARFLAWQIRSRFQEEVVVPWVGGLRLAVRNGMKGATGNIYAGLHEFTDMMFVLHFLCRDDLFLDIGANVGAYAVLASGVCGAKTWAFEPDPQTAHYLRRNLVLNGLEELVTVYELALGGSEGEVRFTIGLDTVNQVTCDQNRNTRTILQQSLDKLIGKHRPTMVKLDVEGYEEEVLVGAHRVLGNRSLQVIELETVTQSITTILASYDFQSVYYDPFSRRLSQNPTGYPSSNFIFARDIDRVARRLVEAKSVMVFGRAV